MIDSSCKSVPKEEARISPGFSFGILSDVDG